MADSDDTPGERSSSAERLGFWQQIVNMATGLSVIVGVLISVAQLVDWVGDSKRAHITERLASLQHVEKFLAADEAVRRRGRQFVKEKLPLLQPRLEQLVRDAGSGEDFYLSADMADFAAVHYHYEQIGAMVKLEYMEFALIFEIIAFPDDYMAEVKPVRDAVAANWKGLGQPLPDFGANIAYLKACYDWSRSHPDSTPACSGTR